jgi:hypothetical protein
MSSPFDADSKNAISHLNNAAAPAVEVEVAIAIAMQDVSGIFAEWHAGG